MRFVFILLLNLLAAAAWAQTQETPFSTNDLSILMPLDATHGNQPRFAVQPGDAKWKILSVENFNAVISAAASQKVFLTAKLKDPANWYLVGMRYAPCTLFAGATPVCKEQLRFIFQSFKAERGQDGFDDYSMHVVYNLRDLRTPEVSPVLQSFRVIKNRFSNRTLNRPLNAHPVLASSDAQAYFEALQSEVIAKHVATRQPSLITFQGLGDKGSQTDHWIFLSGNVGASGKWSLAPLNVGGPLLSEHMKVQDEVELVSNVKTKGKQINIFDPKMATDPSLPWKILDQHQTNDHNVACASCHAADARAIPVLFDPDDKEAPVAFMKNMMELFDKKPRVTELLIENSIHLGKMGFEAPAVRIFGYLDARPLLSQRVVLDSAMAVEQANALLGLKPASQCEEESKRRALLTCMYLEPQGPSLDECMKKAGCSL